MSVVIELLAANPYVDAALVIALGICIGGILNSLTPFISRIPWVGGPLANAISSMSQAITHACGVILAPISDAVGGTFHQVSRLVDWTYGEFRRHASLLLYAATLISGLALAVAAIRALVHRLTVSHTGQTARIKTLEREYKGIEHQIKQLEKEFHGIDEVGIRKHLGTLDTEIARINDTTIPNLRTRVAADEGAFAGLEEWLGIKSGVSVKEWSIALAATLLGAVGLGGLRCNSLLNSMNKRGCGLWSGVEDLLGLFVDTLLLTNVCELVPLLESAVSAVADPLVIALTDVGAGLCSGGIGPAPELTIPALSLPANPGFTLNLP